MKNTFTKLISRLLLILCFLFTGYHGFAQYTANTIATGNSIYAAMAKDQSNNIYVVRNTSGNAYEVVKFTGGNPAVSTVLITGLVYTNASFIYSWGLAVNSLGDVYVTNPVPGDNWEIIKWTKSAGTSAVIQSGGYFCSLAVDASDNLLAVKYDFANNGYMIWKYLAGDITGTGAPVYNGLPTHTELAYPSGALSYPIGLSVDSHNDIYLLGYLEVNGGSLYKLSAPSYSTLTTLGTNKGYTSLTIDASDNLYTSEGLTASTAQVVKYTYPVSAGATGTQIYNGLSSAALSYPWGLVVNSGGQIFANDNAAAGNGQIVRLDPPTSLVTAVNRSGASPTAASTVNYAVTFNRAVTGVTASSFGLTTSGSVTGASIGSVSGSGTIWFVTINTGTGDGTIRLNVNGTGVVPATTNVPFTSGQTYTIDKTAPTGSIVINSGATVTNVATVALTLSVTDSDPLIQMRFSNDGSSWSAYEAFTTTKSWPLSAGDGLKTVYVQYQDGALNAVTYNSTITLDQTAPETSITSGPLDPNNSSTATFDFTSNEAGSTFQYSIDASAYTGTTTPLTLTGIAEGSHTVSIRAIDAAGNIDAIPAAYTWVIDQTAPVVTSVAVPAAGYYVIGSSMRFRVNFNENVQVGTVGGIPYLNVTLASGAVKAYVTGIVNNVVTFTYVVVDGDAEPTGPVVGTLQTNGGFIKDLAGNNATPALQSIASTNGVIVNTVRPTAIISTTELSTVNHALTATVTFSEAVYTLTKFNFVTTNATVNSVTTSDNITYNIAFTPVADGPVQINVPASVVQNIAGNPNRASGTLNFTYDATPPTVTSVSILPVGYYIAGNTMNFVVTFSEPITMNPAGGSPTLNLTIGSAPVAAVFSSSTANSLTFSYTVVDGDNDADGIAVNSLTLNGSTIKDVATNNATLTLNNIINAASVIVNTVHPTVSLSAPAPSVNAPFTATITFSEAVAGFTIGDVVPTNATISNRQTSDNITFTVLVTPTAEGPVYLNVAANAAQNAPGNGNSAAAQLSVDYDITAPAVTSVDVPVAGYYKAGDHLNFNVNFGENVNKNIVGGTPYLNVTIGGTVVQAIYTGASSTNFGFNYIVVDGDLDMDGIVVNGLVLNGSTIKDAAGNNAVLTLNNIGNTANVKVNTTHATVNITTAAAAKVNTPYTATITFSEVMTGFDITDITVVNANLSNLQTTDNITYTVLVTPTAEGDVSLAVAADVAVNIGNNGNVASNTLHVTYDVTAPTITSVSVPNNGYYKAGTTLGFTVNYSENVNVNTTVGTPSLNVILTTGTVSASYVSGSGTNALIYEYNVIDGDQDMNGIAISTATVLNSATIKDVATNNAVNTLANVGVLTGVFVNTTHPTVTLTSTEPQTLNHPITATITFSEAVTGFTSGDVALTNASVTSLTTSDNITYNVTLTPAAEGLVQMSVAAGIAVNVGDNDNQAATDTLRFTYDVTGPVVTSVDVPADGYYKTGSVLSFTVHFNEKTFINTSLAGPYINVTIGGTVVKAFFDHMGTGNSMVFVYNVVDGDQDMDGISITGDIELNSNYIKDIADNDAVLTLNSVASTADVMVNTTHPTVTLSTASYYLVNAPFTATVTFSEAVTGFATTGINATNATISNLQTTDNITYTVLVTPTAEGAVQLNVPADVALNIGLNGNTAAPATLDAVYDITKPVVSTVAVPANGYYVEGTVLNFKVKFDSYVFVNTTAGTPSLNITIGSTVVSAALVDTAGGKGMVNFSYTVQNGELDMDGITVNSLVLNGSTIKDIAGNTAILTLNGVGSTTSVFVNTVHPSVAISSAAAARVNAPYTATITFSEAVTGFAITDINTLSASVSNLQTTDNITYTVLVSPVAEGPVSVSIPADVAVNIANNGNTASPVTLTRTYDVTSPTVTSVTVPANGYYTDGNKLNFEVSFNEALVIDSSVVKPTLDVVIGGTTVSAQYTGMSATNVISFSYTVLPGQMDLDGITIGILAGAIRDIAANNAIRTLGNVGITTGVFVNTARPTVVVSTTAASRVNAPFAVTIKFSEAVTGFNAADLTVTNGTAANLQTTDNITYTADITPTVDGAVSVSVPAAAAQNIATNPNTVSNTVTLTYDITAPVIAAGQAFSVSEKAALDKLVGTVTATETVGTLQNWTITGDDTGGAFSIDNTGAIHVKDPVILASKVNTVAQVTITVSDGLNTSTQVNVAITIRFLNQAPKLDTVASVVMCTNTDTHSIQLTGASAVETDQTYGFSVSADKPNFDALSVSAAGVITYQLKAGTEGITTVTVTIKDDGGTDNGGVDTLRRTFTVTANSLPVISISSDKGIVISKGDIVHLTATGGVSYSWDNVAGNISGELTDILVARPMDNTAYNVTVKTAENCSAVATFGIIISIDFKVDAINILTPNGDGKNDKWVIKNIDSYPNNEVSIYDRTGRLVYTRRNYNNEWDATMNGAPLGEGTYYYILTIEGGKTAKGYITIIRDRN
jgi:gliding motility-associated-like protein